VERNFSKISAVIGLYSVNMGRARENTTINFIAIFTDSSQQSLFINFYRGK